MLFISSTKDQSLQTMNGLNRSSNHKQLGIHAAPVAKSISAPVWPQSAMRAGCHQPPRAGGRPRWGLDGTERRRQRPTDAAQQKEQYSGKKKTHTDKNLLLVNEHTTKVVYLGPTVVGKMHDKKAADEAQICYPTNATLGKDTGFQGYEPAGVLTQQPKKNPKARS